MTTPYEGLLPAIGEPMSFNQRGGLQEVVQYAVNGLPFWVQRAGWAGKAGWVTNISATTGPPPWQLFPILTYDLYDLATGSVLASGLSSQDEPLPGIWTVVDESKTAMPTIAAVSRWIPTHPRARRRAL